MDEKRTKKYPIFTYLCLALLVCIMFTGVTFSRYTGMQSGNIETAVSRFACSYDVTDVSAVSFINSYYYTVKNDVYSGKINTLRTMDYKIRNYKTEDNVPSDVGLKSVLRISGPYEFISNLAWQVEEVNGNTYTTLSPQIVMSDMINNASSKSWNTSQSTEETNKSLSYDARPYGGATKVALSGEIKNNNGTLTGTWNTSDSSTTEGGRFTLSVYSVKTTYTLTYLRAKQIVVPGSGTVPDQYVPGEATAPMFVDITESAPYCTLDIYFPDKMDFAAGKAAEKSFIMSFTIVNKIAAINNTFDYYYGKPDVEKTETTKNTTDTEDKDKPETYVFKNNASGYHYEATVAVRDSSGTAATATDNTLSTAIIRVNRSSNDYTYTKLTKDKGGKITQTTPLTNLSTDKKYVVDGTNYYAVEDLQNYLRSATAAVSSEKANDLIMGTCTDKVYDLNFKTLFLQATENGGGK